MFVLEADVEDCMLLAVGVVVVGEEKTEIDSSAVGCCVATLPHISDPTFDLHRTAGVETPGVFSGVWVAATLVLTLIMLFNSLRVLRQTWLLPRCSSTLGCPRRAQAKRIQPGLPIEILVDIVSWVVAEYIDEVVSGSLQLPQCIPNVVMGDEDWEIGATSTQMDPRLPEPTGILSLLASSWQLRAGTLDVLSVAMHIPVERLDGQVERYASSFRFSFRRTSLTHPHRLSASPWDPLYKLRLYRANPQYSPKPTPLILKYFSPLLIYYMWLANLQFQCALFVRAAVKTRNTYTIHDILPFTGLDMLKCWADLTMTPAPALLESHILSCYIFPRIYAARSYWLDLMACQSACNHLRVHYSRLTHCFIDRTCWWVQNSGRFWLKRVRSGRLHTAVSVL